MVGSSPVVPTLLLTVMVCPTTTGRFVYISFSSVAPSLQLATEKVKLKSSAWMRDRELQLRNMLVKLPDEETAETFNAGTLDKEAQPENMLLAFVTATVLNNGTVTREVQLTNIC